MTFAEFCIRTAVQAFAVFAGLVLARTAIQWRKRRQDAARDAEAARAVELIVRTIRDFQARRAQR